MEPIRLIRERPELRGTCYFELLPGEYQGRCWNNESVFLSEDVFGLIEPIIAGHERQFDHYSFISINRETWASIIADLDRLAKRVQQATSAAELCGEVGFLFVQTKREFATNFKVNADALATLARELIAWLKEQLADHQCVSILGM